MSLCYFHVWADFL